MPVEIYVFPLNVADLMEQGDFPSAKAALKKGADPNELSELRDTPLNVAIEYENRELMELLLSCGAHPNMSSEYIDAPLNVAIKHENRELVELLLSCGAHPNMSSKYSDAPLNVTIDYENWELTELLLTHGAKISATNLGEIYGWDARPESFLVDVTTRFLKQGSSVDSRDVLEYSLLQCALWHDRFKVAHLLLEHGANVNTGPMEYLGTPLQLAVEYVSLTMTKDLLARGADVNAPGSEELGTPHYAWLCGRMRSISLSCSLTQEQIWT